MVCVLSIINFSTRSKNFLTDGRASVATRGMYCGSRRQRGGGGLAAGERTLSRP